MSLQAKGQRYVPHLRISDERRTHLVAQLVDPGTGVALNTAKKSYADAGYEATEASHCLQTAYERELVTAPEVPERVHITVRHVDGAYIVRYHENGNLLDEHRVDAHSLALEASP